MKNTSKEKRDTSFLKDRLIAHRGYHNIKKGIPENSVIAFQEAIKNNLTIELDVHILIDGKVVVFHDNNLKRMTGIDKNIKNLSYEDIKNVQLKETNQKIPLLEDVLNIINGKVPVIIELKTDVGCGVLEKEVIKILRNYTGKYAVKSFNPFSVIYFKKEFPEAIRGQLSSNFKDEKMYKLKKFFLGKMLLNFISKPDFISYDIRGLPNNRVKKERKNKIILGWTIRNFQDLEKARKYCDNYIFENITKEEIEIQN